MSLARVTGAVTARLEMSSAITRCPFADRADYLAVIARADSTSRARKIKASTASTANPVDVAWSNAIGGSRLVDGVQHCPRSANRIAMRATTATGGPSSAIGRGLSAHAAKTSA